MRQDRPRPWEPCGWMRLLVAVVALLVLGVVETVLRRVGAPRRLIRPINRAINRAGIWSGVVTDGRD